MGDEPTPGPEGPSNDRPRPVRQPRRLPSLPAPVGARSPPALGAPGPVVDPSALRSNEPSVDLVGGPGRLYVTVEVPAASRETIHVEATDRRLTIRARGPDGFVYCREIDLPEAVDPDSVRFAYRNGVLDVTVPLRHPQGAEIRTGEDHV